MTATTLCPIANQTVSARPVESLGRQQDMSATTRRPLLSRVAMAFKALSLRSWQGWLASRKAADPRTQEHDPLADLIRQLPIPPLSF